jgi:hypothetical protein
MFKKKTKIKISQNILSSTVNKNGKISKVRTQGKSRKLSKDECGISLNFDNYPFVNFLAHLYDCYDSKTGREPFLKVL